MNEALERLAAQIDLQSPASERLRLAFGHACAQRVAHLIEDPAVAQCLAGLGRHLAGELDRSALQALAATAADLARRHPGSHSIDGVGHAAVSASGAVARALAGQALQAAEYAAYAAVYGGGGHGAVADPASFAPERDWQVECLARLARAA